MDWSCRHNAVSRTWIDETRCPSASRIPSKTKRLVERRTNVDIQREKDPRHFHRLHVSIDGNAISVFNMGGLKEQRRTIMGKTVQEGKNEYPPLVDLSGFKEAYRNRQQTPLQNETAIAVYNVAKAVKDLTEEVESDKEGSEEILKKLGHEVNRIWRLAIDIQLASNGVAITRNTNREKGKKKEEMKEKLAKLSKLEAAKSE
jgi:hypothetical protein